MLHKRDLLGGLCGESLSRGIQNGFSDLVEASIAARRAARTTPSPSLREIPVLKVDDLLGTRRADIRITIQAYEEGMLPYREMIVLISILVLAKPDAVLEIGTLNGSTTRAMAMNLPSAVIHTVDLPIEFDSSSAENPMPKDDFHLITQRQVGREFRDTEYATRITQHFGDTATWNFNAATGATLFFIDGSHTYEYCKNDSEKCFELCKGRGIFLWHDCDDNHPGIVRFLAEWRKIGRDIVRIENTSLAYWHGL